MVVSTLEIIDTHVARSSGPGQLHSNIPQGPKATAFLLPVLLLPILGAVVPHGIIEQVAQYFVHPLGACTGKNSCHEFPQPGISREAR